MNAAGDSYVFVVGGFVLLFLGCSLIGRSDNIRGMLLALCLIVYWQFGMEASLILMFVLIAPATFERVLHATISGNPTGRRR